jgi:hypothetical protein
MASPLGFIGSRNRENDEAQRTCPTPLRELEIEVSNSAMATTASCVDSRQLSIAPYQFKKAKRVADGIDLAHFVGVNSRNGD